MKNINRGSEWRKWDLHLHTHYTFLNKYTCTDEEFVNKIIEEQISCIGLTNYFKFDDREFELKKNLEKNDITVFLNLELRLDYQNKEDDCLDLHVIFSNLVTKEQIIKFLHNMTVNINGTDKKLIDISDTNDFKKAVVNFDKLLICLNEESIGLKGKFLVGFLSRGKGNARTSTNYEKIVKDADLLIHSSDNEKNVIQDKEFWLAYNKPLLQNSDAHTLEEVGSKYTWIKANPTFEGLKQIIYEPKERVKIQSEMPESEKLDNLMIEKVTFTSSENRFTSEPIYFNKNLNVIIGGKSSGKSILLYNIARTLSTDDNLFKDESIENKYNFRENNEENQYTDLEYNFEVNTKVDGVSQKRFDENNKNIIPDVKYIPQNYLIKLAEPEQYKKGESLNKIIRKLIIEDKTSKEGYNDFLLNVKANDKKRENLIKEYLDLKEKILSLDESLKGKSDKLTLEKNIESNLNKINELKKNVGLTQEEINKYNDLQDNLKEIYSDRDKIINDYKKIKIFNQQVLDQLNKIRNDKKNIALTLENDKIKYDFENKYLKLEELTTEINQFIKSYEVIINEEGINKFISENIFKSLLNDINKSKKENENLLDYFRKNEEVEKHIKILENSIEESRKNLSSIIKITNEKLIFEKELKKKKIDLFLLYISNFREYILIIENLRNRVSALDKDGLKITGLIQFNFPKFRNKMLEISHGGSKTYNKWKIFDENFSALYNYNIKKFIKDIKEVFESIDNDEYILLSKFDKSHAINNLLDDYFFDYWQVEYKKDKLGKMSTGKASFVILMIIIGLSDSKTPILIDQPEDNLDNRSVTNELVQYLKEKKKERQIILVTHNANIVVNADAENIIVANQRGQNEDDQEGSIYQFDYINGALEDTFPKDKNIKDLLKSMGIREHIAEIVEGGKEAFKKREEKYGF
jgi:hypothetical protein